MGIVISIVAITLLSINTARTALLDSIEDNLKLEVHNLMKMFEREYALKLEKLETDLKVVNNGFYQSKFVENKQEIKLMATNQISGLSHEVKLKTWFRSSEQLQGDFEFVDKMQKLLGGTVTIFQKIDSGLLRISTNVLKLDGSRALGTYIPNLSSVVKAVENGDTYYGRAYVVNDWYITAYEPIISDGSIVGALYVGGKEKDIQELRNIVMDSQIGLSGFPYVFDDSATFVIHPVSEGENWYHLGFMRKIIEMKKGVLKYFSPTTNTNRLTAFDYFDDFHFYVAATIDPGIEAKPLIDRIVINSLVFGIIILVVLSLFVYFVTADGFQKFLQALDASNRRLNIANQALRRSEKLAELGQLSAGIIKEINTPLLRIKQKAKSIKEGFDPDSSVVRDLNKIVKEAENGRNILSGVTNLAQDTKVTLKETNINEMILVSVHESFLPDGVEVKFKKDDDNPVLFLDTKKMMQALKNIIKNSIDSLGRKGIVHIVASSDSKQVQISIEDNGQGIPEKDSNSVFASFYTSKNKNNAGFGLGLAVTYSIIDLHLGKMLIKANTELNSGGIGTRVVITLPRN
jgi:methyl-accepting chemotaxis protein